jgi:L-lactate dehydrogenase complex protein LldG
MGSNNPILNRVRQNLNRSSNSPLPERPPVFPPRKQGDLLEEVNLLIEEIQKLSGVAKQVVTAELEEEINEIVLTEDIKKAVLWPTPRLNQLKIKEMLANSNVEVIPHDADKYTLASCDLGITEVDFVIPDTGTIGLLSGDTKPRSVSLLPRIHLALVTPSAFRPDLHQVLEETGNQNYMVLITGPSRTADIELTVALGVHGPKSLYAWVLDLNPT